MGPTTRSDQAGSAVHGMKTLAPRRQTDIRQPIGEKPRSRPVRRSGKF
ncbi:MAG: hypothetical protein [Olavius algarvensis Gamma 1 endosymbiont]|nr:MAG: hypothetical protein [Olavius algarvensis Gamma 1 endosymbiont]